MGTERLKPLHNFNLPPGLKWGNQRQLRCMKINRSTTPPPQDNDISAVRQMVMLDLQTAANKMKQNILKNGDCSETQQRPWNVRTRRAAVGEKSVLKLDLSKTNDSIPDVNADKSSPMRESGGKREREKFSVALTKKEIDEDFEAMGLRLPRRPKKRARTVQKQLDTLFPGLWLTEVTADMYKVTEPAP